MHKNRITAPDFPWASTAIAIVLIATGTILVAGDYAGVLSLDNVRNFWPLALIAIGVIDLKNGDPRQD